MSTPAARHYLGDPSPITDWTCPACGEAQTVPFGEPCVSCGAGAKPFIVDRPSKLPPPPPPMPMPAEFTAVPTDPILPPHVSAFDQWWEAFLVRALPAEIAAATAVRGLMRDAFEAGFSAGFSGKGLVLHPIPHNITYTTVTLPQTITFDPDGAVARTLAAALALFCDQVLSDAAEEIASGEWCSLVDAQALVQQLTKEGSRTV